MAHVNSAGIHIEIGMSSPTGTFPEIGTGLESGLAKDEASFFGNLFLSPPQGFYCHGKDTNGLFASGWDTGKMRCGGYPGTTCPFVDKGNCLNGMFSNDCDPNLNSMHYLTVRQCRAGGKTWQYPITTWVASTGGF